MQVRFLSSAQKAVAIKIAAAFLLLGVTIHFVGSYTRNTTLLDPLLFSRGCHDSLCRILHPQLHALGPTTFLPRVSSLSLVGPTPAPTPWNNNKHNQLQTNKKALQKLAKLLVKVDTGIRTLGLQSHNLAR